MIDLTPLRIFGALAFAVVAAGLASRMVRTTPRLAPRLRPYTVVTRSNLGQIPDVFAIYTSGSTAAGGFLRRLVQPMIETLVKWLIRFTGRASQEHLLLKLKQSNELSDVPEDQRVHEFRVRQVVTGLKYMTLFTGMPIVIGKSPSLVLLSSVIGAVVGGTRQSIKLNTTIENRRNRMCVEIYTVNQQLAMYMRTGGSTIQAVQRLVQRGNGEVIGELKEVLRLHSRGMSAGKAFLRAVELTPEPSVARTYKLLATGAERGADLANALLALSDDVRETRRDVLKRAGTKRRGQMLIPIVGLLAPLMMLFIIAPLPSLFIQISQ